MAESVSRRDFGAVKLHMLTCLRLDGSVISSLSEWVCVFFNVCGQRIEFETAVGKHIKPPLTPFRVDALLLWWSPKCA